MKPFEHRLAQFSAPLALNEISQERLAEFVKRKKVKWWWQYRSNIFSMWMAAITLDCPVKTVKSGIPIHVSDSSLRELDAEVVEENRKNKRIKRKFAWLPSTPSELLHQIAVRIIEAETFGCAVCYSPLGNPFERNEKDKSRINVDAAGCFFVSNPGNSVNPVFARDWLVKFNPKHTRPHLSYVASKMDVPVQEIASFYKAINLLLYNHPQDFSILYQFSGVIPPSDTNPEGLHNLDKGIPALISWANKLKKKGW